MGDDGYGTATIRVKDINNHVPIFTEHSCLARVSEKADINAEVYPFTPMPQFCVASPSVCQLLKMSQTSALVRVMDPNSLQNALPFHFSIPADYRHSNNFYLPDNLNGTASLTALRTFDRERQEFLIR
ncbi:hypothetical protein NHX12_006381 [Muraenolepis orangiensis]|uniref:Cadherin domain-containing protein n=1 Tax=Muraenolepis orangiensis TaxID=630683 RepID=A0A9Q0DQX5_9TELE|nr:hypothetical protein NHX12_006381 [Muraenolepis orangiensis]